MSTAAPLLRDVVEKARGVFPCGLVDALRLKSTCRTAVWQVVAGPRLPPLTTGTQLALELLMITTGVVPPPVVVVTGTVRLWEAC